LLLKLIDNFEVMDSDVEEVPMHNEAAREYVLRVARDKAQAARNSLDVNAVILSADTEVVFQDQIMGKPESLDEAVKILQTLSGQMHYVYTAVVLYTDSLISRTNISKVWFRTIGRDECEEYCRKYKPLDKAGAYGIQDIGAGFITRFEGSFSSVMGLPLRETQYLLKTAGLHTHNLQL
jgi:septum formation protein